MKVGFISLGCSKNLVDTENIIGNFRKNEYEIVNDIKQAEIIVINTCGFIDKAKEEAINTIQEMIDWKLTKEKGSEKFLIVTGCLVQRYKQNLEKSFPEVDLFIKIDEYNILWEKIDEVLKTATKKSQSEFDYQNRVITTGKICAYLKIAEGCSNMCSYCTIPYIRGPYISRKMEDILEEAKVLEQKGIKELIVIAQDTTRYGVDIYGKQKLPELLERFK